MTSTQTKVGAYSTHQRGKEDARETDARALLEVAPACLKAAIDASGKDPKAYGDAIRHNQRLWTMFQTALCDPENQLPQHLKLTLLNLSRYIDRIQLPSAATFSPPLVTELIEINRMIAAGLTKPKNEATAAPMPETAQQAALPQSPVVVATSA